MSTVKKILVVDDVKVNRALASAYLKREGWTVSEAVDGEEALELLSKEHDFQAVLLDISMPGMNGDEVCSQLRADEKSADLPIVAYTAHALEENNRCLFSIGFDAVLIKPINAATLYSALNMALSSHANAERKSAALGESLGDDPNPTD